MAISVARWQAIGVVLRRGIAPATLVALAALVFLPAVWSGFVADDFVLLQTAQLFRGLGWALHHNDLGQPGTSGHFYRPLWVTWNGWWFRAFGSSALAFHLLSILLYAIVTLEVWLLARRLLGPIRGWIAAAAFALYPRHGESVAWISGNTDLTAVVPALGALLVLSTRWRSWIRVPIAVALAIVAVLCKEVAYVLPLLATALVIALAGRWTSVRRGDWIGIAAMTLSLAAVLTVRGEVLGGVGGYATASPTFKRAVGALGSAVLASFSPPQLPVLRTPALLLIPVLLLGALVFAIRSLRRRSDERLPIAIVGGLWYLVALLPSLNLPVDLNSANGERLLFLPSVGLAVVFAAVLPLHLDRLVFSGLFLAAAGASALCLLAAQNWVVAGEITREFVSQLLRSSPRSHALVLLSVPSEYRTAHVLLHGDVEPALSHAGRGDLDVVYCAPVQVQTRRAATIQFRALGGGRFEGTTTWDAPFDFPVFGRTVSLSSGCSYSRIGSDNWPPGLRLRAEVRTMLRRRSSLLFFDGRELRRCCPSG
jgi:Dolichyl-phosphate-mannose-protein mannosyltransferase